MSGRADEQQDPYASFREDPKAKLWLLIRDALWERWDPIGVNDAPDAIDEYDGYVNPIVTMAQTNSASEESVFGYLWQVETEQIGLPGNREHTKSFVTYLCSEIAKFLLTDDSKQNESGRHDPPQSGAS